MFIAKAFLTVYKYRADAENRTQDRWVRSENAINCAMRPPTGRNLYCVIRRVFLRVETELDNNQDKCKHRHNK